MSDQRQAPPLPQLGYRASRKGGRAKLAGWCRPGETHSPPEPDDQSPPDRCVTLFGPEDEYVATFSAKSIVVSTFDAIGVDRTPLFRVDIGVEIHSVYPAGTTSPFVLYGIDADGKCWMIDLRPNRKAQLEPAIATSPRLKNLTPDIEHQICSLVILRQHVLVQARLRRNVYELWSIHRTSFTVLPLGTLDIDDHLTALDPARSNILLGHRHGELCFVLTGKQCPTGKNEVRECAIKRVTAAVMIESNELIVARKGGSIVKVPLKEALSEVFQPGGTSGTSRDLRDIRAFKSSQDPDEFVDDEPCRKRHSAELGFTAHHLHRAGSHFIAVDKASRRMTILDQRLNVKVDRKLDRDGTYVQPGQTHTQNMLLHTPRKQQFEAWHIANYVQSIQHILAPDLVVSRPVSYKPLTYWGQKKRDATVNSPAQLCVFPVIDRTQTFGDTDMSKLLDQVSTKIFLQANEYYMENSFGEVSLEYKVFGEDIYGIRTPLVLSQPVASYFYEAFREGGLEVIMPGDWSNPVVFDGTEALEIQANPGVGAARTYNIPFAALWGSGFTIPNSITFNGTETLELTVETQTGDTHVLNLSFPAKTLTVDPADPEDTQNFLNELQAIFTDAIRAAESGIAGSPTLIQDVVFRRNRSRASPNAFNLAQSQFRIISAGVAATRKGRISVTGSTGSGPALALLGLYFGSVTGVMDSVSAVNLYFIQCLRAAQTDAGEDSPETLAYLAAPEVRFDASTSQVNVKVNLTEETGGKLATINVLSSSRLEGSGWDTASPNPGSENGKDFSDTVKLRDELINETFTAALDHIRSTTTWDRSSVEKKFSQFDMMTIAFVGAPHSTVAAADQWSCTEPTDFNRTRVFQSVFVATDQNPPAGEEPIQMGTNIVVVHKFCSFTNSEMTYQTATFVHELGHGFGLPDLYRQVGHRDDVQYLDNWDMMALFIAPFHHFCGYSKWSLKWIADDPDSDSNRTIFVDLPAADATITTEAWLVPVEYWDDSMREDVIDVVGSSIPIGQLMKLNLGSDGGVTAFLELRAKGNNFSQNLRREPTVIATNGLDPNSDRYWAVDGLYRRNCHLLNNGTELRNKGDTWDFAQAAEFPIKGCTAKVVDVEWVRSTIPLYRVAVERTQAEYIDLHFQDHVPGYRSPDIWIDWPGDNPDPSIAFEYPEGTPTDQGETVRFPSSGEEKHYVVARVHNAGNVQAENVWVNWFVCEPPGAGDDDRWVWYDRRKIDEIKPDSSEVVVFDWKVTSSTNAHQCMRMEITDWSLPREVDPSGHTVALASEDVRLQNNVAQQNVFNFEALGGSPFEKIMFPMQVHNDRRTTQQAALIPTGLPYGSKLTISPGEHSIPSGQARVFQCTLQLDEKVIVPGCDNDSGFLLTAWRRDVEADENWGSCFYHIRPRFETQLDLREGSWVDSVLRVSGLLRTKTTQTIDLAQEMPLVILIRLWLNRGKGGVLWKSVMANANGVFQLATKLKGFDVTVQAMFDRGDRLGSAVSTEIELQNRANG